METIHHHEVALRANTGAELARLHANRHASFISIESYLAWMPDEELMRIFQQVGDLPDLQTFRISFSFQRFRQLPVLPIPSQALVTILESATKLTSLTLDECRFVFRDDENSTMTNDDHHTGSSDDLERLSLALQRAPNLKQVTLFNCFPHHPGPPPQEQQQQQQQQQHQDQDEQSSSSSSLADPLAVGLANIPCLEELSLIFTLEGPDQWIRALLRQSCSSQTMRTLRINVPDGCCLGDTFQFMCHSLERNSVLRELSIRCPLDYDGGIALGQALASPQNCLEEIYVQMKNYQYAIPIAQALKLNNRHPLKSFELRVWTGGDRIPLLEAYEQMIPHNLTLEQLIIDNGRHGLTPLCDFYLALNRAGRKALLERGENLRPQTWIDFMVRLPHDPDVSVLFYTLSLNPCLIVSCNNNNNNNNNKENPAVAAAAAKDGDDDDDDHDDDDTPMAMDDDAIMNIDEDDKEPRHKRQKLEI